MLVTLTKKFVLEMHSGFVDVGVIVISTKSKSYYFYSKVCVSLMKFCCMFACMYVRVRACIYAHLILDKVIVMMMMIIKSAM